MKRKQPEIRKAFLTPRDVIQRSITPHDDLLTI